MVSYAYLNSPQVLYMVPDGNEQVFWDWEDALLMVHEKRHQSGCQQLIQVTLLNTAQDTTWKCVNHLKKGSRKG